jgi:hypothetical protein
MPVAREIFVFIRVMPNARLQEKVNPGPNFIASLLSISASIRRLEPAGEFCGSPYKSLEGIANPENAALFYFSFDEIPEKRILLLQVFYTTIP